MKKQLWITLLLFAAFSGANTAVHAEGRVGDTVPEFQLQGTDGKMYGITYADNQVSVICLIGYS